jgi:dTDP-4-amino-4,6-dideoxygalactose transaminase
MKFITAFYRPIHHTFAPHVDSRTLTATLSLLLQPWKWKEGRDRDELRTALAEQFHADVSLFASGREGLLALLRALQLKNGDEVIVQAYTCIAVPNAITAAGCSPVYADVERETLNLNCEDTEHRITPRTRAIICQHTFGIPADTARLREICDRHNLFLIEDCAHVIPDASGSAPIGVHGDFLLLSFGRDKAIFGITGGAILSRKPEISARLKGEESRATPLGLVRVKQLLLYPLVYSFARPFYGTGLGKGFLAFAKWVGALVPILSQEEKEGRMAPVLHKLPNACAALALQSFQRLKELNDHRRALTALYLKEGQKRGWLLLTGVTAGLPLQKFPIFVKGADETRGELRNHNIHLDDGWTGCVICPPGSNLASADYKPGSDPEAEAACEKILSLPTHPTMTERQAQYLAERLDPLLASPAQ